MTTCLLENEADELKEILQGESLKTMTENESETALEKKKGSFLFRKDNSGKLFMSGIDVKGELHHAKIEQKDSHWIGMNIANHQARHLRELVCLHLDCDEKETSYCATNEE